MNLEKLIDKPLSNHDLQNMVPNSKLMTYNELSEYNNIDDLFGIFDVVFILYETQKNFGHWCVLLRRENSIEHFDSYGLMPDQELKFTDDIFRKLNNMDLPHLTYLLYISEYPIEYNDYQLQKYGKGISTCGRWCIMRALLKDYDIDTFAEYFLKNKHFEPDEIVTILTEN